MNNTRCSFPAKQSLWTNSVPMCNFGTKPLMAASVLAIAVLVAGCNPLQIVEGATVATKDASAQAAEEVAKQELKQEGNYITVPEDSPVRNRLVLDKPRIEDVRPTFSAPASVEADPAHFARIFPPLSGRVIKLNVRLGEAVAEGQALAVMDSPDFNQAQGDYIRARSMLELADKTLKRTTLLYEHGVAAQKEVEQAKSDHEVAESELERARTRVQLYTQAMDHKLGEPIVVKSPISGRVVDLAVGKGEFRNDAVTPLMTVADLSTVWLTANVQEKDLCRVHKDGDVAAVLSAYPEESFEGKVLFIGDMLDPDTRCVKVRVAFPNPEGRLKPGMFATATFTGKTESVITVPNTAIFQMNGASRVFVESAPWQFEPREVKLGIQKGERTIVMAGLDVSARIVAKEGSLLR